MLHRARLESRIIPLVLAEMVVDAPPVIGVGIQGLDLNCLGVIRDRFLALRAAL